MSFTFQKLPEDILALSPSTLSRFAQHVDYVGQSLELTGEFRICLELLAQVCLTCDNVFEVRSL